MGTWQMPLKIPPARVTLTSRTAAGAASLTKWIQKNPDLLKASNGLRPEILGKVPPPSVSISSRYDSATPAGGPLTIWLARCRPLAPSGRLRAELRTPSPTAQGHLTSPGSASVEPDLWPMVRGDTEFSGLGRPRPDRALFYSTPTAPGASQPEETPELCPASTKSYHHPQLPSHKPQFPRPTPKCTPLGRPHPGSPQPRQRSRVPTGKPMHVGPGRVTLWPGQEPSLGLRGPTVQR